MNISAKVIAHSNSAIDGKHIVTFELVYPRFIHSELMTHRVFSRNAASSRAIPIQKVLEMVRYNPAMPVHWGKNQPGMQAKEELSEWDKMGAQQQWLLAKDAAAHYAGNLDSIGVHKQIVNRVLEPFQWMKTVVTSTEWANWFWLRNHEDAQPEIKRLAEVMLEALKESRPVTLEPGDWHVPYFGGGFWLKDFGITFEDALAISASCCAQVSYRTLDDSLDKAKMIYSRLVESEPVHASPFEHQATPMERSRYELMDEPGLEDMKIEVNLLDDPKTWQRGITHVDRDQQFWSGNLRGWVQHRQLIKNNTRSDNNDLSKELGYEFY